MSEEKIFCPSQGGSYVAYIPEYLEGDKWKRVPTETSRMGVPQDLMFRAINDTIGVYSYEQAHALAWGYSAHMASLPFNKKPKIRIQAYEVHYDIKTKPLDVIELS